MAGAFIPPYRQRRCISPVPCNEAKAEDVQALRFQQKGGSLTSDLEKRKAIEQHWAAYEVGDTELEHRLCAQDAVLEYPQSDERFIGRSTIAEQRGANPAERHFRPQRVLGAGSMWVSECLITYDGVPTISVSIMEFDDGLVVHETQYFADPFEAPASRAQLAERFDPAS